MSDEILKIINQLNNERNKAKRFDIVLLLLLSACNFLFIHYLAIRFLLPLPYSEFITSTAPVDEIFINLIFVLLAFIFSFLLKELVFFICKHLYYLYLHLFRDFSWNITNGLRDWDFQGNVVVDEGEEAIHIIQSDLGFILKKREWKDYEMSFKFKLPRVPEFSTEDEKNNQLRRGFGVIYRARRLR